MKTLNHKLLLALVLVLPLSGVRAGTYTCDFTQGLDTNRWSMGTSYPYDSYSNTIDARGITFQRVADPPPEILNSPRGSYWSGLVMAASKITTNGGFIIGDFTMTYTYTGLNNFTAQGSWELWAVNQVTARMGWGMGGEQQQLAIGRMVGSVEGWNGLIYQDLFAGSPGYAYGWPHLTNAASSGNSATLKVVRVNGVQSYYANDVWFGADGMEYYGGSFTTNDMSSIMLVFEQMSAAEHVGITFQSFSISGPSIADATWPPPVPKVVFTNNTTIGAGIPTYDGQAIVVSNCTLTVNGAHSFASFQVISNGLVTHTAAPAGETNNRLDLTIAGDVMIDATSRMDADAKGYGQNAGPGGSMTGSSGAGHGGLGTGNGVSGANYGSILRPSLWGSGGGPDYQGVGGSGGGLIHLVVGGTLTVEGAIRADGQDGVFAGCGYGGGGSGGSIWMEAGTLAGGGFIAANGGKSFFSGCTGRTGGAGAGGRIAAYYTTSSFTGNINAFGADGYARSGAGTIYLKGAGQPAGTIIVDNGGTVGSSTPVSTPVACNLVITNRAVVYPEGALILNNLLVAADGLLTHLPAQLPGLDLTVAGDAAIEAGGVVSAQGKGYGGSAGPGTAQWDGAGYGGGGGAMGGGGWGAGSGAGGPTYGSITQPLDFGSGGGNSGGSGGGLIRLTVGGKLNVNGAINANGNAGSTATCTAGSGGSGGSVFLTAGELAGSGTISANGGQGWYSSWCSGITSGGGGGGRIAAYFQTNTFAGSVLAAGGSGYLRGGAGTIYTKAASLSVGDLLVDNAGTNGAMTLLSPPVVCNVMIANAAVVYSATPVLFNNMVVATGGTVTHLPAVLGVQITCLGNLTIESNGLITAQGKGYGSDTGPGTVLWAGAGYGGRGGACQVAGGRGPTYGSMTQPLDFGSGGAHVSAPGGSGGGLIRLTVAGKLVVNGAINANGEAGSQAGCTAGSGGSGGSIYLTVGELSGGGSIQANGGQGWSSSWCSGLTSGGGGGGRMAIYGTISSFQAPVLNVSGGFGWQFGETGSYVTSTNVPPVVVEQIPAGLVNRFVREVEIRFDQPLDTTSFTPEDIVISGPSGPIPTSQITLAGTFYQLTWRIGFPTQTTNGSYSIVVGPHVTNLFGQEMTAAYRGAFDIQVTPPTMSSSLLGSSLTLAWPTVVGFSYQLQSATNLAPAGWANEGAPFNGNGSLLSTNIPIGPEPRKFFRLQLLGN